MKTKSTFLLTMLVQLLTLFVFSLATFAQSTAFTYQGRLSDGANAANGSYDLRFAIFDALNAGAQQGNTVTNPAVVVSNGFFTTTLDFGNVFPGADRFLEIGVRTNGSVTFITLLPRQKITATPYAITAGDVTSASIARLNVSNTTVQATGHPIVTSGFITGALVDSGGSGYTTAPNATVNDATGSGAVITATVSNGSIVSLTVNNAGVNYSAGATLTIGAPPSNAYQIFGSTNFFVSVNRLTNANNVFAGDGSGLNGLWRLNGNAGTTPGAQFVGTTDNQPIEIKVNNIRALRLEASPNDSNHSNTVNVVAGSPVNSVTAGVQGATLSGGGTLKYFGLAYTNRIRSDFGTIGGGRGIEIQNAATDSAIAGGNGNTIMSNYSAGVIGGGEFNAIGGYSTGLTIGSGNNEGNTVGGGINNVVGNRAGGSVVLTVNTKPANTISGGYQNTISTNGAFATISGGAANTSRGEYATIPGGAQNLAAGDFSFAAGYRAKANHDGAFVWADSQDADFASSASNQFLVRASGGVGINVTNPLDALHVQSDNNVRTRATATGTGFAGSVSENSLGEWFAGVASATNHWYLFENAPASGARIVVKSGGNVGIGTLAPTNRLHVAGGVSATAFVNTSDRNAKENFVPVSPQEILHKVSTLPISTWNFKTMNDGRHMGPMAQDFHAAFGLGGGDTTITSVDPDGVALAAIQGLNQKLEQKETELAALKRQNERLEQRLETLEKTVTQINKSSQRL